MKKFLLVLGFVLLFVITGFAIFIATFDADRYRPLLVDRLQQAIKKPVKLDHISLGWHDGIALQLQGLAIKEEAHLADEPLIQVESASALVRLLPLLHKEIQIASLQLSQPKIHVVRDAQGKINLFGLAAVASPAAASSEPVPVGGTPVAFQIASLRIDNGTVHWDDAMTQPSMSMWIKSLTVVVNNIVLGQPMDVDLKAAVAADTQNLHFSGRVTPPSAAHEGSIERVIFDLEHVPLEQLLPPVGAGEPQLHGALTTKVQGSLPTLDPHQLVQTVSGRGEFLLDQPVLSNLNILRAVFERFSMIPGLVETLESRLPPAYQAKFAAKDTVFSPIHLSAKVESGALQFENLDIRSDILRLTGTGRIGLEGSTLIRCTLQIEPVLSAAIIKSVKELEALTNTAGEMEIPVVIQGQAPRLVVVPDLNYVASKVITKKAVNVLEGLLDRKSDQSNTTPPTATGDGQKTPTADLLGDVLRRALEKRSKKSSPQ